MGLGKKLSGWTSHGTKLTSIEGLLPFKEATWTVGVTHSELKESNVKKVAVSDLDLP